MTLNLDKKLVDDYKSGYINNRVDAFIKMSEKHISQACNCLNNAKVPKTCGNVGVIDLSKMVDPDYVKQIYDEGLIDTFYNICMSVSQSLKSRCGKRFEDLIEDDFKRYEISYDSQVCEKDGYFYKTKQKNGHVIDFLVPQPQLYPCKINTYEGTLISAKTSLRERWAQDTYINCNIKHVTFDIKDDDKIISVSVEKKTYTNWLMGIEHKRKVMNVLDLFCGAGGFTSGIKQVTSVTVLAGIDVWDTAIKTYGKNNNHLALCKDLKTYGPEQFSVENGISDIDIIVGGPPCQGFSNAGKRSVNDPRNSLFMEFVKYINYFKPKAFIMENVMGILSMKKEDGSKCIDTILEILSENYNTHLMKLYASDFGVPQNRRRVIIMGIHKSLNILPYELKPTGKRPPISTVLLDRKDVDSKLFLSEKAIVGINRRRDKNKKAGKGFGAQYVSLDKPCYTISARYWKDG